MQSFSYDGNDKLTGGTSESETYDLNGNLLTQTVSGQTTSFTWDDEGRLTRQTFPDGHKDSDTFTYTGLGLRLTKNDSTGGYAYFTNGVSPAASILSDGRLSFTPGISQTLGTPNGSRGLSYASHFYVEDAVGNLRGMTDGSNQGFPDGLDWDGFGRIYQTIPLNIP